MTAELIFMSIFFLPTSAPKIGEEPKIEGEVTRHFKEGSVVVCNKDTIFEVREFAVMTGFDGGRFDLDKNYLVIYWPDRTVSASAFDASLQKIMRHRMVKKIILPSKMPEVKIFGDLDVQFRDGSIVHFDVYKRDDLMNFLRSNEFLIFQYNHYSKNDGKIIIIANKSSINTEKFKKSLEIIASNPCVIQINQRPLNDEGELVPVLPNP